MMRVNWKTPFLDLLKQRSAYEQMLEPLTNSTWLNSSMLTEQKH